MIRTPLDLEHQWSEERAIHPMRQLADGETLKLIGHAENNGDILDTYGTIGKT